MGFSQGVGGIMNCPEQQLPTPWSKSELVVGHDRASGSIFMLPVRARQDGWLLQQVISLCKEGGQSSGAV